MVGDCMKKYILSFVLLALGFSQASLAENLDLEKFGRDYFDAFVMSQRPNATAQDIENYLALLADDVGYQHLPNAQDDSRAKDNKQRVRKGMTYYLGANTEFAAELLDITTGMNVVVLKYHASSKGFHPQLKKEVSFSSEQVEVLEIEGGKVSVIRKYSQSL